MPHKRKSYPGNIERRGDGYRVRLCVGGKRHVFTVALKDRRDVEQFARQKHAELAKRSARRRAGLAVTFSELLERFEGEVLPVLTPGAAKSYRDSLKPIRLYWVTEQCDPMIDGIRAASIVAYLSWRRTHRLGGGTVVNRTLAKDRAVLHRLFAFADRLELREGNPVARVPAPKYDPHQPVILTADQLEKLLQACADRPMLRTYALLLAETGLRAESEALRLRWEDLDFEGAFLVVVSGRDGHRTKSGKTRWVPLTPRLTEALRDHAARFRLLTHHGARSPWVFHHTEDRRHHRAGERVGSLYDALRKAAETAELPAGFRPHDLRHRRVTTWLAEGRDVALVKEALGHSDLRITMAYAHLTREHLSALTVPIKTEQREKRETA